MNERWARMLDLLRGLLRPKVLVTGMPKSGTTALAMLLGEAAGLRVNSDPFHRLDQADVEFRDVLFGGALSIRQLLRDHRHEFRGGMVKDPNFVFFLDDLLGLFPEAGFVFIVRDPRANIRSILNRLDLPGRPEEVVDAMETVPPTWRRVLEGRTPDVECDDYVQCAMERWRLTVHADERHADRLRLVRYEDFNRDKPGVVKDTLARLGLPNDRPIEHVMDRQFQPRGDRSTRWDDFFGEERLKVLERECAREMSSLGYTAAVPGA